MWQALMQQSTAYRVPPKWTLGGQGIPPAVVRLQLASGKQIYSGLSFFEKIQRDRHAADGGLAISLKEAGYPGGISFRAKDLRDVF